MINKKKTLILSSLAIVGILGTCLYIPALSASAASADKIGIHSQQELQSHFKNMKIQDSKSVPNLKKEDAIQVANKATGKKTDVIKAIATTTSAVLTDSEQNKIDNTYAQYAIMTNKDILVGGIPKNVLDKHPQIKEKGYLYEVPVWIISYEGENIKRSKGVELHERNIVVDADTGEVIYGFNYR